MFGWAKGLFESIASARRLGSVSLAQSSQPQFESGLGVELRLGDKSIGSLGVIRSAIRKEWRLSDPVAVLEISIAPLVAEAGKISGYKDVPAFPSIQRDVAMVVDEKIRNEEVVAVMKKAAPPELETIQLFDIFAGEAIGKGRKSMAYSLTFRSPSRTLTDEDANRFHESIKAVLRREVGAEIREG
jgi:phenylalanyl-tRNA synthetase beta chain